jgi:hypothetical protein
MPRRKVRTRVRVGKDQEKPGRGERLRQLVSRWQYSLLIGIAAVASVALIWVILSRMGSTLPPPPE